MSRIFRAGSKTKNWALLHKGFRKPKSGARINKDTNENAVLKNHWKLEISFLKIEQKEMLRYVCGCPVVIFKYWCFILENLLTANWNRSCHVCKPQKPCLDLIWWFIPVVRLIENCCNVALNSDIDQLIQNSKDKLACYSNGFYILRSDGFSNVTLNSFKIHYN